jgi:hypothetical protein
MWKKIFLCITFSQSIFASNFDVLIIKDKKYNESRVFNIEFSNGNTASKIIYGHPDVGFFESDLYKNIDGKLVAHIIPPSFKREISFYTKKESGWKFIKKHKFTSPYLDIESLFETQTEGRMSKPFFIASMFMYKHGFFINRFKALKNSFSKSFLEYYHEGIQTLNVIFNNLGEVVFDLNFEGTISDQKNDIFALVPNKVYLNQGLVKVYNITGELKSTAYIPFVNRTCRFFQTNNMLCLAKDEMFIKLNFFARSKFYEMSKIWHYSLDNKKLTKIWEFNDTNSIGDYYFIDRQDLTHENSLDLRENIALVSQRLLNRAVLLDTEKNQRLASFKIKDKQGMHSARFINSDHIAVINNGDQKTKVDVFNINGSYKKSIFPPKPVHSLTHGDIDLSSDNNLLIYFHNHRETYWLKFNYVFEIDWVTSNKKFEFSLQKNKLINYGNDFTFEKIFSRDRIIDKFVGYKLPK